MKWCPPTRIQKLFIVLHINHKQTEENCWLCCIKHVSCFLGLRLKPKLQNMLEYIPCSMQVPLQVRKSLYARRANVMGNLKGFYLLKFREEKRSEYPSLHWPPFLGCCHFCTTAEHNLPPNWRSPPQVTLVKGKQFCVTTVLYFDTTGLPVAKDGSRLQ